MSIRWTLLSSIATKARSSHCASVTAHGQLLLYSGELRARIPVEGSLSILDLEAASSPRIVNIEENNGSWRTLNFGPPHDPTPEPRVGATTVYDSASDSLYLWGGRGGVDMSPLDRLQSGIFKASVRDLKNANDISWERLKATNDESSEAPDLRSYHASVFLGGKVYIHAGCPSKGRLATLHTYDLASNSWKRCADAPAEPRGGTSLAAVVLPGQGEHVIIRFGGFAGYQLPALSPPSLDVYSPGTDTWSTLTPSPDPVHGCPGPRSVCGLVPFTIPSASSERHHKVPIALLYYGERNSSSLGHAGAGDFWDDVWALLASAGALPVTLEWKRLDVAGQEKPDPRGWFPSTSYTTPDGGTRIVLSGGLLSTNERSGEVWVGDVQL